MEAPTALGTVGWRAWALVPVVLLALCVALVVSQGDRVVELVGGKPPPADEFDVRRVQLRPGEIRVQVRNPQRDDLTIASVTVDDAIVPFSLDGPATLGRLRSSTIVVPYDWVEGEPLAIGVTSSTGIQTTHALAAAVETPVASARGFLGYAAIGLLVGVVPVALGLMWLPSLRRVGAHWLAAFMALTAGLLTFLGVEALAEAPELQAAVPSALGGPRGTSSRARSHCSSRSGSACTTSARASRSARPSPPASSSSARSSSSGSWCTTSPRGSGSPRLRRGRA